MNQTSSDHLYLTVGRCLAAHDNEGAAAYLERLLLEDGRERFAALLQLHFTNSPAEILEYLNSLIAACRQQYPVQAVYLAHNGLVLNYDRWYLDSLAYDRCQDLSPDYEWLCRPRSHEYEVITLTGLEAVQRDFGWYSEGEFCDDPAWTGLAEVAETLVKVRIVQLVQTALASGQFSTPVPVFVTAYGPDFYCRFDPLK